MGGVGSEFWVFCWLCTYGSGPTIPSLLFIGLHTENRMRVGVLQGPVVQTLDSAIHQALVVQKMDSTNHWINHYPLDKD